VPADLPANGSEKVRARSARVRLITYEESVLIARNYRGNTAESYRWSQNGRWQFAPFVCLGAARPDGTLEQIGAVCVVERADTPVAVLHGSRNNGVPIFPSLSTNLPERSGELIGF
jgi:hypothetical protein